MIAQLNEANKWGPHHEAYKELHAPLPLHSGNNKADPPLQWKAFHFANLFDKGSRNATWAPELSQSECKCA